jgi:hypothetical protein
MDRYPPREGGHCYERSTFFFARRFVGPRLRRLPLSLGLRCLSIGIGHTVIRRCKALSETYRHRVGGPGRRPRLYVVAYGGHRSAPGVLPALAGVVHDRQNPDQHRHGEDDQYGGFHCDLATAGPTPTDLDSSWFKMNPPRTHNV